jgi:hypothetical protein
VFEVRENLREILSERGSCEEKQGETERASSSSSLISNSYVRLLSWEKKLIN